MSLLKSNDVTRRDFIKSSAAVGSAALLAGRCGTREKPPNILWIITDDHRIDSFGCYGSSWGRSPNIDSIAETGTLFRHAICAAPVCAPTRVAQLSGKYGHRTGVMENKSKIEKASYPLPIRFTENGYQVANFGKLNWYGKGEKPFAHDVRGPGYGGPAATPFLLDGEFKGKEDEYGVIIHPNSKEIIAGTYPLPEEQTEQAITTDNAIKYMNSELKEPFLLRVSLIAPHSPVLPPKPYDTMFNGDEIPLPFPSEEQFKNQPAVERNRLWKFLGSINKLTDEEIKKARAAYYGLCISVDNQVGRLMEVLRKNNLMDNTIVVFTADQGWQLGEHGLFEKENFYEQTVLCPLIISWPGGGVPKKKVVDTQVETIDLLPTLIYLAQINQVKNIDGKSFEPLLMGRTNSFRDEAFSQIDHGAAHSYWPFYEEESVRRIMVRTEEWKLAVHYNQPDPDGALYNLKEDPGETNNLYSNSKYKEIVKKFEARIRDWAESV